MCKFVVSAVAVPAFLATAVTSNAADMPGRMPEAPPPSIYVPPPFSFTGFFLGGDVGGAWIRGNVTDTTMGINVSTGSNSLRFIGGGQAGFNLQMAAFVVGIEGDFNFAINNSSNGVSFVAPAAVPGIGGNTLQIVSNNNWVSTLAARFGFVVDHTLLYGKFGGGWVGNDGFAINNTTSGASIIAGNTNTNTGWLVGGGLEYAFSPNWTIKIEYDYLGLNNAKFTVPATSVVLPGDTFTTSGSVRMVKLGINYLFNLPSPYAAPF